MSFNSILDLLSVFAGVLICLFCLLSWGQMTLRLLGIPRSATQINNAWIGLATIIGVTNLVHLAVPITWHLSLAVLAIALANYFYHEKHSWVDIKYVITKIYFDHPLISILSVACMLILSAGALLAPGNYDSGLYHFPTIAWLNQHPIVLGLGNLHGRLAFNQSYFSFVALLNIYPVFNKGYTIAGPTMMLLGFLTITFGGLKNVAQGAYLQAALILLLGVQCADISAPTPDLAINVLQIVIFSQMLLFFWRYSQQLAITSDALIAFTFQCFLISTLKLSGIAYGLTAFLIVFWRCVRIDKLNLTLYYRLFSLVGVFAFIHIVRSLLLSGAPFYPSSFGLFSGVSWAIPLETVQTELNWTYSWARRPGYEATLVLGNWDWFKPWLKALPFSSLICGFTTAIFLPCFWIAKRKNGINIPASVANFLPTAQLALIPLLIAILFWFTTAPDIRFLGVIHVLLAILSVWLTWSATQFSSHLKTENQIFKYSFVSAIMLLIALQLVRPKLFSGFEPLPTITLKANQTLTGQVIYSPISGEQCGSTQLPCTPYFNANLKIHQLHHWWLLYSVK